MRISTSAFYSRSLDDMLNQQYALSVTQSQLSTGKRIQTPADDPIGAVHVLALSAALADAQQYERNANAVTARLATEEQALADSDAVVRRVRELTLQVNNSVGDAVSRNSIASEIKIRIQELMDIANRRDGNGEYLFSGYATGTQPFARSGSSVVYSGDQGVRLLQTGPTQRIADADSGFETFMNVQQGNGKFVTGVNAANTGSGSIDVGTVLNAAAWTAAQPNSYTISFTAPNTYQILDGSSTVIGGGTYTSGNAIVVNGAQVTISGAPAAGDVFTVAPSQKEDIFTTLDNIVAAIQSTTDAPASQAQFAAKMAYALQQLDQDENHLLNVRSGVGARLSTVDDAKTARAADNVDIQTTLSAIQDVDYVAAISSLNQQMTGLQAAQKSYAQISQLSLFNYLR